MFFLAYNIIAVENKQDSENTYYFFLFWTLAFPIQNF